MPTADIAQATFLGGTVIDFNCSMQFGENGQSQLQVRLVEDKLNIRSPSSVLDEGYGQYTYPVNSKGEPSLDGSPDPNIPTDYPNGDNIYFPGLGNAVYFSLTTNEGTYEYGGIINSWERNIAAEGTVTYSCDIISPNVVLDGVKVILGDYHGIQDVRLWSDMAGSPEFSGDGNSRGPRSAYPLNTSDTNLVDSFAFPTPTYNYGLSGPVGTPSMSLGMYNPDTGQVFPQSNTFMNILNPFGYLEQDGIAAAPNWGASRADIGVLNERGMAWRRTLNILAGLINNPVAERAQFGGTLKLAGSRFFIDFSELGTLVLDDSYRLPANIMSLSEIIGDICRTSSHDYYLALFNNGGVDPFDGYPISGTIKVKIINRSVPAPSVTLIQQEVESRSGGASNIRNADNTFNVAAADGTLVRANHGRELRQEPIGKVILGGPQTRGALNNCIWQLWNVNRQVPNDNLIGTRAPSINDSTIVGVGVAVPGMANPYIYTVREMRHAMAGKDAWQAFVAACRPAVADMLKIGASFRRMTPTLLSRLRNGRATPHDYAPMTRKEVGLANKKNTPGDQTNERADYIWDAIKKRGDEYYGKMFFVPLPVMMFVTNILGQRRNEWEVGEGAWVEPHPWPSIGDPNFYDDKGRMKPYLSYGLVGNNLDEFKPEDFVSAAINTALLVNLQVEKKVYYLSAPNGGLYPFVIMTLPARAKKAAPFLQAEDYNGLLRSIELQWIGQGGVGSLGGIGVKSMGADACKFAIAAASAYPVEYHVPQVAKRHIYGPWATTVQGFGKVDIEYDPGMVPENFGSLLRMNQIALLQCWAGGSRWMEQESGDLTFVGGPGINMGEQLPAGGPFCTGIRVEVGSDRILTTYNFETWKLRYGKLANFYKERVKSIVDLRNQFLRELSKYITRSDVAANARALNSLFGLNAPNRFRYGSSHDIFAQVVQQDGVQHWAGSMSRDQYQTHAQEQRTRLAYCSGEALFRGFGATGGNSYFPGVGTGNGIGGLFPAAQNLNHFNVQGPMFSGSTGTDGTGVKLVKGFGGDEDTFSVGSPDTNVWPSTTFPLGLRAPLMLVGWGYDTCGQPVPTGGQDRFPSDHRMEQASWKAGPLSVNWHETTKTWVPQPTIYMGTAQGTTCDGEVEVLMSSCGETVTAQNPLAIPVGQNSFVVMMLDIYQSEFNIVNTGVTKQEDYVVCDLTCCEDGSLKFTKRTMYIHEDPDECAECEEPECPDNGGGGRNGGGSCPDGVTCIGSGASGCNGCPCCDSQRARCVVGTCVAL